MKLIEEKGLTFDDVLLEPRYNKIKSRQDVTLSTNITREIITPAPIISANMDTITESEMAIQMYGLGGLGIVHRFMSLSATEKELKKMKDAYVVHIAGSLGLNDPERIELLLQYCDIICIDVAHGHCEEVIRLINDLKDISGCPQIIAGNVATIQGVADLADAGADAIKVGIGPGSMCTTRLVTGNGVPQFTAIRECSTVARGREIPIIADGGIRTSGDMVKALAAGASSVMVGSLLAGTDETPGEVDEVQGCKVYRGMASKDAMTGWKGNYHAAPEGESTYVMCKGPVKNVVDELLAGIRSGMTYQGARNIKDLRDLATFRLVSPNCLIENRPHGK